MTYPIDLHPEDTRPLEDQQDDLIALNIIQDILEEEISSYVLENPENLFDEEYQQILRKLDFSRGLRTHQIIIAPDGYIRWISPGFPSTLLQDIHNVLLGIEVFQDDE